MTTTLKFVLVIVVSEAIVHGLSPPLALLLFAGTLGALAGLAVVIAAVMELGEWFQARRVRSLEWRLGPVLGEWMGKERIQET